MRRSGGALENEILANANQYCAQAGRQLVPVSKDPTSGSGNPAAGSVSVRHNIEEEAGGATPGSSA